MARRQSAQRHDAAPESGREEIRGASVRLPERQREALELRVLEQRSYEEIAAIMETSRDSVAQLIYRARINLYDELRGTVLASVAPPSPDCERALPLIAARDDEQLEASSGDAAWLDAHLAGCDRCRLGEEQMRDADASYRSQAPVGAAAGSPPGTPPAFQPARRRFGLPRGRLALAGALAAVLLLGGLATAFVGDDGAPAPAGPAADTASARGSREAEPGATPVKAHSEKGSAARQKAKTRAQAAEAGRSDASGGAAPAPTAVTVPTQATTGGGAGSKPSPTRPSGKTGVEPTQPSSTPQPTSKPAPTATPTSQPASEPTPTTEAPPPAEEPSDQPGRSGEAPGKPAGQPQH
jgi:predicted DNA-binding protein (UPF0251 family)